MRNGTYLLVNQSNASNFNSAAWNCNQVVSASFAIVNSDSNAAGTVKLQVSNEQPPGGQVAGVFVPTEWVDIPNATATVTAGVAPAIVIGNMCFQQVRAVWTNTTPGTGTMKVRVNFLSI